MFGTASNKGLNQVAHSKQGVGTAQFTSYDERAAASGGEVLYGLDKELAEKAAAKYDPAVENACRMWIENVTGDKLGECSLQEELKNGVVLCNLINAIKPGLIKPPKNSKMPFMQMENISMYLEGCTKLGVPSFSSFQTVSLYENKDMGSVLNNIQALGSAAQKLPGYSGPVLGTKIAEAAPRQFSEAQMRRGSAEPTFMGKGSQGQANASGMVDRSRGVDKLGHVALGNISRDGGGAGTTFLGTGSHGGATQAGDTRGHHNVVKGPGFLQQLARSE